VAERREELRAADVDRAFVAERLKSALDEGRLSLSEYDERLQETYASRTYGDLDKVLADLPGHERAQMVPAPSLGPTVGPASAPLTVAQPGDPHRRSVPRWLAAVWGAWLTAVLVNVAIWGAIVLSTGHLIYFWPIWVAGPWGAVLFATTITGLLSGEPPRSAERHASRAARRAERRARRYG
jgi:hypothetical protein